MKDSFIVCLQKDMRKHWKIYMIFLPVFFFYLIFAYKPMYGLIIAFKDYSPIKGIMDSPWTTDYGLQHFISFFQSYYFGRVVKNTIVISLSTLLFAFPIPIILALLLNEVKNAKFKRTVQTLTYMPHFISLVVACSMIRMFVAADGPIDAIMSLWGGGLQTSMLAGEDKFVPIYVLSELWQHVGWDSIIYIAALSAVDQSLYEAAGIDGAGRLKQIWHVALPGISTTIIVLIILRIGSLMSVGYEKIILLYNQEIYNTADVISSFVYRKGLIEYNWSFSTAVGLFNSVINFVLVMAANKISRRFTSTSLW